MYNEYGIKNRIYELEDFFGKETIKNAFEIIEKFKECYPKSYRKVLSELLVHAILYQEKFQEHYIDNKYALKLAVALKIYELLKNNKKLYEKLKSFYFKY